MITTCGVYLIDKNNLLLVCKATGGGWSIPKGELESNESLYDGAKRELLEETGVDLDKYVFMRFHVLPESRYKKRAKKLISYAVQIPSDGGELDLVCNSFFTRNQIQFPEIQKFAWMTLEAAKALLHESQVANLFEIQTKWSI